MRTRRIWGTIFVVFLMGVLLDQGLSSACLAQEPTPSQEPEAGETEPTEIIGAPNNITEHIAIYVFLGWLWLSILVLIYLLRLKIKECDRLDNFAYYGSVQKKPLDT